MSLATHPGSFSATLESLTAPGCSPLRMGTVSNNVVRRYVLMIRPRSEAVIAAEEGQICFWTNLTQVN